MRARLPIPQGFSIFCIGLLLASAPALSASYVIQQVGSGNATLTGTGTQKMATVGISTLNINRSAAGFGDTSQANASVVEGVYYTYAFTVTGGASAPTTPTFDVQNQMNGLWSGWGSANNGNFQNGPTSSSWSRGWRYQHRYPGGTATSTDPTNVAGSVVPPLSTIATPTVGDRLSVGIYLYALTNDIEFVYSNLTTGATFSYTFKYTDTPSSGVPLTNLTFNSIAFRSDSGITDMAYTFGTLHVVPEPSRLLLIGFAAMGLLLRRRR